MSPQETPMLRQYREGGSRGADEKLEGARTVPTSGAIPAD
jgi:hypothetical protein